MKSILNKELFFRVDAGGRTGMGHLMRCLALAQGWQDQGGKATFISCCESDFLTQRIQAEGFNLVPLDIVCPDPADISATLAVLQNGTTDQTKWLVLDGYHFTPSYQKAIREAGMRLLVIDDMNHLPHYHADIILNQNIHASSLNYSCESDAVKLLGCEYVLLRREFLKYKDWQREIPDKAKKILVTMGGTDPDNVTLQIIEALKLLDDPDITARIILGPANPHQKTLRNAVSSANFKAELLINPPNMPELMMWADMAVTAGGSTCWEIVFMGLPNVIIVLADNQLGVARELDDAGAGFNWGWHESITLQQYTQRLTEIIQDKNKRLRLSEQGKRLVDGQGGQKIIRVILAEPLQLRRVGEKDCQLLWQWANDPVVRQSAFNSKNIAWKDHQAWFLNKQNQTDCFQYMAINRDDVPVGQIRFDMKNSIAEVDYSIDKIFRGMGLGQVLLEKGIELFCTQTEKPITIRGCVKKGNEPSKRTFQKAGFLEAERNAFAENDVIDEYVVYQLDKR